jgi:hypothetical protein
MIVPNLLWDSKKVPPRVQNSLGSGAQEVRGSGWRWRAQVRSAPLKRVGLDYDTIHAAHPVGPDGGGGRAIPRCSSSEPISMPHVNENGVRPDRLDTPTAAAAPSFRPAPPSFAIPEWRSRVTAPSYDATFSRTVWWLYGGATGLVMWYSHGRGPRSSRR